LVSESEMRKILTLHQVRLLAIPHVVGVGIVNLADPKAGLAIAVYVDAERTDTVIPERVSAMLNGKQVSVPTAVRVTGSLAF